MTHIHEALCLLLQTIAIQSKALAKEQTLNTQDYLPGGGHYSAGRRVGNLIFTAGQVPRDAKRNILGENITDQTKATFMNLEAVLAQFDAGLKDIIKVTVHLENLSDVPGFNEVFAQFFPETKPVRTVVGSRLNGVLVEVDVIASSAERE